MEIRIVDLAWGFDRVTGKKEERQVDEATFPAKLGKLGPMGPLNRYFEVVAFTDHNVTIQVNDAGKQVTIEQGNHYLHAPALATGGHRFLIELR